MDCTFHNEELKRISRLVTLFFSCQNNCRLFAVIENQAYIGQVSKVATEKECWLRLVALMHILKYPV